ncbi:CU044_5270 family protein [Streptomyces sp. HSW2009]|uniref:CU044_5270 family protein n=1 Tax=Streptomyces sp. HSW2009 TaxID=3142890 RepID=UPI0032EEEA32
MNGHPWQRDEEADREELAALLPAPGARALDAGRHRELREGIVREIGRQRAAGRTGRDVGRQRWKHRLTVVVVPVAVAVTVVAAISLGDLRPDSARDATAGAATSQVQRLDRLAAAQQSRPPVSVGKYQYVYARSVGLARKLVLGQHGGAFAQREEWRAANAKPDGLLFRTTLLPANSTSPVAFPHTKQSAEGVEHSPPTLPYDTLRDLPTDPVELRKALYMRVDGRGPAADDAVLELLDSLLVVSKLVPDVQTALFRVALHLPGVTLTPGVRDGAGRPGVGLSAQRASAAWVTWVFDEKTVTYLGTTDAALLTGAPVDARRDLPDAARPPGARR